MFALTLYVCTSPLARARLVWSLIDATSLPRPVPAEFMNHISYVVQEIKL